MFIYLLLILGFFSYVVYNQRIIPKAIKENNAFLIYALGIIEGLIIAFTNSGFVVPFVFISGMLLHWKNFSQVQKFNDKDIDWVNKNLKIRSVLIVVVYSIIAFIAYV